MMFNIPNDVSWSEYFYESDSDSVHTEDEGCWTVVGEKPKPVQEVKQKWCRDGNACQWSNCKFRHERCSHYDNWIRRGKKGHSCRSITSDPASNKRPDEGGCMYDHRDPKTLKMFVETVPCSSESELWDHFMCKGLEPYLGDAFEYKNMTRLDRALLIRSLKAAGVEFDDTENYIMICFD
jgi:hypothetical protein